MAEPEAPQTLDTFIDTFTHFIRIDFSCKQVDEERPHEIADLLLQGAKTVCQTITNKDEHANIIQAQLWPTILTTCEADALISREAHQDRGALLVGLQGDLDQETISKTLQSWRGDIKTTTLFIDYIPTPSLAAMPVERSDLGQLVVDSWTYPELLQNPIVVFEDQTSSYHIPILSQQAAAARSPKAAGSAVAAATARRSPSPNTKKLTPASAILNRLKWDVVFDSRDFAVVYEDRHAGLMESPVDSWITESTEETFIPMHRVRAIKKKSTGMVVWHREERIDLISGS